MQLKQVQTLLSAAERLECEADYSLSLVTKSRMRGALPPVPKSLCLHVVVGLILYYLLIYRLFCYGYRERCSWAQTNDHQAEIKEWPQEGRLREVLHFVVP
jgi:hypothetical protein